MHWNGILGTNNSLLCDSGSPAAAYVSFCTLICFYVSCIFNLNILHYEIPPGLWVSLFILSWILPTAACTIYPLWYLQRDPHICIRLLCCNGSQSDRWVCISLNGSGLLVLDTTVVHLAHWNGDLSYRSLSHSFVLFFDFILVYWTIFYSQETSLFPFLWTHLTIDSYFS